MNKLSYEIHWRSGLYVLDPESENPFPIAGEMVARA